MENPHEQQHTALLNRIISNVRTMNEKITEVNSKLEDINKKNEEAKAVCQMWSSYDSSVRFHLQNNKEFTAQPQASKPANKTPMLRQNTPRRRH
ncbi:hypothetical protein K501DRAFT_209444 [Backusella circina FSU 941]|nr:hypothetical protein K501DRAFT_209444 [Backusella circina FSU 941]